MTQAAVAAALEVSDRAVRKFLRRRPIPRGVKRVRGRLVITDAQAFIADYRETRNEAQIRKPLVAPPAGDQPNPITAVEIRLKEARARRFEQDADTRAGLVVPRAEMRRANYEVGKAVRENIENIADRICGQLATMTDPVAIRALLAAEHRRALDSLADQLEQEAAS